MFCRFAGVLSLYLILISAAGATVQRDLDDWYDPNLPVYVSDVTLDPSGEYVYASDQISGRVFRKSLADGSVSAAGAVGFSASREDVLSLYAHPADFEMLLEGEIKLEWAGRTLAMFDTRKAFGSGRWVDLIPAESEDDPFPLRAAIRPTPLALTSPRIRDQGMLAQAIAELAGRGHRVRPWRWSAREGEFQVIDRRGHAFLFSIESGVFGQKKLRYRGDVPSLYANLAAVTEAELDIDTAGAVRIQIGTGRFRAALSDDPYTGDRAIDWQPDSEPAAPRKSLQAQKKSPLRLPPGISEFLRQPKLLAEGPAGQLISCKIHLTEDGSIPFLVLAGEDRMRILPVPEPADRPEDVVTLPEGFLIRIPPFWHLAGWTEEFSGLTAFGNSRFEQIAPIQSSGTSIDTASTNAPATTGLFVLDAASSSLSIRPIVEWPRYRGISEIKMQADPLDLTIAADGSVYVLARRPEQSDTEIGFRLFRLADGPEPVLELPAGIEPYFVPSSGEPTLVSKSEIRQTVWTVSGQPPALVRKESLGIVWSLGQDIAWKPEPDGVILFSTDPAGESDTAATVVIEGAGEIRQAVKIKPTMWLIETDSGILRLDVEDVTAPEILEIAPAGESLRPAPSGAYYTVSEAGSSEVRQYLPAGKEKSLGHFREEWIFLGTSGPNLYFKDRSTGEFHSVRRFDAAPASSPEDNLGQVSGRIKFDYDDPAPALVCLIGDEAQVGLVRPETPTFLLGPLPPGYYRLDVSAGLYDLVSPRFLILGRSELALPDVQLTKTLDFIFRRATAFEEAGNAELAKFNYLLYLDLHPMGRMADRARSRLMAFAAAAEDWDEMNRFFRNSPASTRWDPAALHPLLDHLPTLADRLDVSRQILRLSTPSARSAPVLFFLYKYSRDPQYKAAAKSSGIPRVYRKFFESFDSLQP